MHLVFLELQVFELSMVYCKLLTVYILIIIIVFFSLIPNVSHQGYYEGN